ncbi:MAG TPA: hypothetical protein VGS41_09275, partial [Chthonomonadales bacterium]|nr:hypothetical protein [Chthonomonadales bacterium]
NDAGYRPFDPSLLKLYVDGYRHIIQSLQSALPGVRITLLTAPAFDDVSRKPAFPGGYNGVLEAYGEEVKRLGAQYGLPVADTNAPLVGMLSEIVALEPASATHIIPDRVHPGPAGHLVMAAAVLKAWNAPTAGTEIDLNAASPAVTATGAQVREVRPSNGGIAFSYKLGTVPWPFDRDPSANPYAASVLRLTHIERDLNRYVLRVTGLSGATSGYRLMVDGSDVGHFSEAQLSAGIDLAELAGLPDNVQSQKLLAAARRHNDIHYRRWRQVQVPTAGSGTAVSPAVQAQMDRLDAADEKAYLQERSDAPTAWHHADLTAAAG